MKKMQKFNKNHYAHHTMIRYFLSYFLPLFFLMVSFFFIIHGQLSKSYLDMLNEQADRQLNYIKEEFSDGLMAIDRTNHSLISNINLILSRYDSSSWSRYVAFREVNSYAIANELVEYIVYYDRLNDDIYSSGKYVVYDEGSFHIYRGAKSITFCPDSYQNSITNQLIYLKNEESSCLLYYPYNDIGNNYIIFYVINEVRIQNMLKSIVSDEILATALVDSSGQTAVGINQDLLTPYLSSGESDDGILQLDSQTTVQTCTGLYSDFSVTALISNRALMSRTNQIFSRTYIVLFFLGIASIFIVLYAMGRTYLPLRRLTQKIVKNPAPDQSYLEQLDLAFSDAATENQNLQKKIEKYRLSMQKSIFDSILFENHTQNLLDNVDSFFTLEPDDLIFALRMRITPPIRLAANPETLVQETAQFLKNALPEKSSCLMLEYDDDNAMFLLSYAGPEQNKEEALLALLENYCEEKDYLSALSNGSSSPLDIPSLYENALLASSAWDHDSVVSFRAMDPSLRGGHTLAYPYDILDGLAQALKEHDFPDAESRIRQLFALIDSSFSMENTLPDFFVRCVLIDILTAIINAMNQMNVKFKDYSELYFEALYFCRSFPYREKKEEIQSHIGQLLGLFESEAENQIINAAQIGQLVEENFTSADFSISYLADIFHVSIAYMSYLFKKEMGENFSDYVWALRLKKAKEPLLTTDMPIDDISLAVGYVNTSSFRRKFKQAMGMTPSQLRC
nr:helix-turn-helix domain-containing protein [uncultured Acetatifactor sp.]